MATALAQLAQWHGSGLPLTVSVNLGAQYLQEPDFMARLHRLLAAYPAALAQYLELEVLETSALKDLDHIAEVMEACQAMGVQFALDDFGTGPSSLAHLKHLPAAQVKIDQSFVGNMLVNPQDLAIIEGVIDLAQVFQRQVVAEGVETLAHGKLLLQLGCELAQGFSIARPMPAVDLLAWLEDWQAAPTWQRQHPLHHDDWPLLFAHLEISAWIKALTALRQETAPRRRPLPACPSLHLEEWLHGPGQQRYGHHPHFQKAQSLYQTLTQLGQRRPGQPLNESLAKADLQHLRQIQRELLGHLKALGHLSRRF
jgi:EAL domain-containing protein (putative c-di-GMP-specific phosphodiesterase class I)